MIVLDAHAFLALLEGHLLSAPIVAGVLRNPGQRPAMSAANVAEVIDQLVRVRHCSAHDADSRLELASEIGMETLAVTPAIGRRAGQLRATLYHRSTCDLALGDCLALATALAYQAELMTGDQALLRGAARSGVSVIALPA